MPHFETSFGKIFYQDSGLGPQTIGFMNGVMASVSSWDVFKGIFVKLGFRVITFDFIGQLRSDKPKGPYTFDQHVQEALELYDYLKVDCLHLIGTSYGSEVAMKFTLTHPKRVRTLTVIDGTAQITQEIRKTIDHWMQLTYQNGYEFFWGMAPSIYHPDYIKNHYDFLEQRAKSLTNAQEYLIGQRYLYETFLNEAVFLDELDQIKTNTLIVVGEQDTLKPPILSQNIHSKIENSEYVLLPNCGHVAIFEKANELATCLVGFIQKKENEL